MKIRQVRQSERDGRDPAGATGGRTAAEIVAVWKPGEQQFRAQRKNIFCTEAGGDALADALTLAGKLATLRRHLLRL